MLLQDWISTITQPVFVGILLKADYDVLGIETLIAYAASLTIKARPATAIAHLGMFIIAGTTLALKPFGHLPTGTDR